MSETVVIRPLSDPVIDTLGHDPRAPNPERFWLPTLGPTALLLLRHLADRFDRRPDGFELVLTEASRCLGLGEREGRNSPLARSLGRLVQFDLAAPGDDSSLAVRRRVPPINRRHVRRLPDTLQEEHEEWVAARLLEPPLAAARRNARRTAVLLLGMGDSPPDIERTLAGTGFHPAVAREAVVWATDAERDGAPHLRPVETPSVLAG